MSALSGRVAAITGASAGIGAACARAFARAEMAVVLGARRVDRLEEVRRTIERDGGRAVAVESDVTREPDLRRLVDAALQTYGRLDVMVCNAGAGYHAAVVDTPPAVMQRLLDVNLLGTLHAVRAALPHFLAAGRGHIVIISSIVGRRGLAGGGAYAATKFAQIGLGEALRSECAGTGIAVSLVYPVGTDTEFRDAMARDFGRTVSGAGPRQSADRVAASVLRCLERPRAEVYPYPLARGLAVLAVLLPGACDRLVQRFARRRAAASTSP